MYRVTECPVVFGLAVPVRAQSSRRHPLYIQPGGVANSNSIAEDSGMELPESRLPPQRSMPRE